MKIEKLEDSEPLDITSIDTKAGVLDVLATKKDGTVYFRSSFTYNNKHISACPYIERECEVVNRYYK